MFSVSVDPMIYLLQDEKAAEESNVNKPDSERIKVIQKIDNLVFELGKNWPCIIHFTM